MVTGKNSKFQETVEKKTQISLDGSWIKSWNSIGDFSQNTNVINSSGNLQNVVEYGTFYYQFCYLFETHTSTELFFIKIVPLF